MGGGLVWVCPRCRPWWMEYLKYLRGNWGWQELGRGQHPCLGAQRMDQEVAPQIKWGPGNSQVDRWVAGWVGGGGLIIDYNKLL